jgi:putative cell wall-binding protein
VPRALLPLLVALAILAGATPLAAAVEPPKEVSIERLAGPDRYSTAVAISQRLAPGGDLPVVYLVSGLGFADALAAGPAAIREGGAILLTPPTTLPASVEAELTRLSPERIVVVGGPTIVSDAVMSRAATVTGASVERVFGRDRYATAAALSARAFATGATSAFLVSGSSFADALAAGPIAGARGAPILLTGATSMPASTAAELRRLGADQAIVVGGPAVVGGVVSAGLVAAGLEVARFAGQDRYATAAAVAAAFRPEAATALVTTGVSFPDALAGAPLAASLNAPILLVRPGEVPVQTRDAVLASRPMALITLGGLGAVREPVVQELAAWSKGLVDVQPPSPTYPSWDSGYTDFSEMVTRIHVAEAIYPAIVDAFSIGKSHQGRDLWAVKISDNVATDEAEPEVLVDALHHAREHLTVEQAMHLLRTLTEEYTTDTTVHRLVDSREIFIVFAVNPDGWWYDLGGSPYRGWRRNRQPTPGSTAVGTDLNRNYDYRWGCCGGSSSNPAAWNYRGTAPFSATESRVMRDFVNSRVVGGKQQIRTHVTLHTNGEMILWPYGYTKTDVPSDMRRDDHATFVAMGRAMAARNGYKAQQSSDLYVTDGDQIDWMYGRHRIFSFTFELYPSETKAKPNDHEPPDEVIAKQTARNRSALLYLIDAADCPWKVIGKGATYCG